MAGNSQRKGAIRKRGKGATVGSGGNRRRGLEGKGPTPKASERTGHPAARRAAAAARRTARASAPTRRGSSPAEWLVGRNPVVEALRAHVPATALHIQVGIDADDRTREALRLAGKRGLPILEVSRTQLDRSVAGAAHQGIALTVPPFDYTDPHDLLELATRSSTPALLVVLDGITDPRNLGAMIRSAAAFGAHGVVIPSRRSAGVTASAWKTSAGAASRVPVARVTNLVRGLTDMQKAGVMVVGLDAGGSESLPDMDPSVFTGPVAIVVGAEGSGLARLTAETCDFVASIPMTADTESLNASVAGAIALHEVARARRA